MNELWKSCIAWIVLITFSPDGLGQDDNELLSDTLNASSYESLLERGRDLFVSVPDSGKGPASCASCHLLTRTDTLNLNPDAFAIGPKSLEYDLDEFRDLLSFPMGSDALMEGHMGYEFEDEELKEIRFFLGSQSGKTPPPDPKSRGPAILFTFLGLLIIMALLDLYVFQTIHFRRIHWILITGCLVVFSFKISDEVFAIGLQQGYRPDQPVKFSHKLHCTDNHIHCDYCHRGARLTATGEIPSTGVCMNCHRVVREGSVSGESEISMVIEHFENQVPIRWIKVHNLPDHVCFSHVQHTGIGGIDCAECHGKVEKMDLVRQESDLSMKWCLDCHAGRSVGSGGTAYYTALYTGMAGRFGSLAKDSVLVKEVGGWDCMKCHH